MERKEGCVKAGFSTILWAVLAVLLCAAPCIAYDGILTVDTVVDLGNDYGPDYVGVDNGWADVYGTLNMYPGAYVEQGIYAYPDSTVNMYAGDAGYYIWNTGATITVYGKAFALNGTPLDPIPDQVMFDGGSGTLTVIYDDDSTAVLLLFSDIAINLVNTAGGPEPEPISVQIDIKPGSDINPINQGSNGVIPVAILTTDSFDASTVDPGTVTLAGAEVAVRGKSEKLMARMEDIDGDGDDDLLLQVETQSDDALWESGTVTLLGKTYDGQDIMGTDEVIIVPPE